MLRIEHVLEIFGRMNVPIMNMHGWKKDRVRKPRIELECHRVWLTSEIFQLKYGEAVVSVYRDLGPDVLGNHEPRVESPEVTQLLDFLAKTERGVVR